MDRVANTRTFLYEVDGVDIFGRIIDGSQVEDAMMNHLRKWLPVYLQELEYQRFRNRDQIPHPRSIQAVKDLEQFDENQLPAIIVMSSGLSDTPVHYGDGSYSASWDVNVATVVTASDAESTRKLAKLYGAAVRAVVVQKPSLGGFASGADWLDESYDDLPGVDEERTFAVTSMYFSVSVDSVINRLGGPRTYPFIEPPDEDTQPGSHWPLAETVTVEVEPVEEVT